MTREEALVQLRLGPGINEDVSEEYNEAVNMAIEALEQPSERTEERTETHECDCISKTGHWEWVQYESKSNFGNWHCSECRCILCGEIKENPIRLPKYCPECGAKMQEVQK